MDTYDGFLIAIGWFLLRFGLPILATVLICWFFKRLDSRWQAEGEYYRKNLGIEKPAVTVRCWLFNDCPDEKLAQCKAYQEQNIPCWQHFRGKNGLLKEDCIGCGVFRGIPKPVIGD